MEPNRGVVVGSESTAWKWKFVGVGVVMKKKETCDCNGL